MDNTQILTVGLTISVSFLAVLVGVLFNSTRLTDLRVYTDGRLADVRETLRAEIRAGVSELKVLIEKNHSEMLARFADVDQRLIKLEAERRVVQ